MKEPVKQDFTWEDLQDAINPCDWCGAIDVWPLCDDDATSTACNHCAYNIYINCANPDPED